MLFIPGRRVTRRALVLVVFVAAMTAGMRASTTAATMRSDDALFANGFDSASVGCPTGQNDTDDDGLLDLSCITPFDPLDPAVTAPPIDPTVITTFPVANEFIYTSPTPVQAGVAAGTIASYRLSILRGRVVDGGGQPLTGALVRVLDHPELGYTYSRGDGYYDIAVNGGGEITVDFRKDGFLRAQRAAATRWNDWALVTDVAMAPVDGASTVITSNATTGLQIHRASPVNDADGTRQATLMFPTGTTGHLVGRDGSQTSLTSLHVRATEYTVGSYGPARMPAELPTTSGYTYAVELSADEAQAQDARRIEFDQPIAVYFENHLGFPVGAHIPLGYYDFRLGSWLPSPDGRVIKILGDVNALASLDVDGSGQPADAATLAALGITDEERVALLTLYSTGQVLWRTQVRHFTPWDCNFPYGPPPDAQPPAPPQDPLGDPNNPDPPDGPPDGDPSEPEDPQPCQASGSIIDCSNADLGESLPVPGTALSLNYRSDRLPGSNPQRFRVRVNITGGSIPEHVKKVSVRLKLGGYRTEFTLDPPQPNYAHEFNWDGLDAYGRAWQGDIIAKLDVGYVYDAVYYASQQEWASSFGSLSGGAMVGNRDTREITIWSSWNALGAIAGRTNPSEFLGCAWLGPWRLERLRPSCARSQSACVVRGRRVDAQAGEWFFGNDRHRGTLR